MNIVPIYMNLFVPWGVFVICCGVTSFHLIYSQPMFAGMLIAFIFIVWLASIYVAIRARKTHPEPTWFTYAAIMLGISIISGTCCGLHTYMHISKRYYRLKDLKILHQVDTGKERGQSIVDAGIVYFAQSNQLDRNKSWHFSHRSLYCVAPIDNNWTRFVLQTKTYDFWAVGKDCCSMISSNFQCDASEISSARSAIRIFDDDDSIPYYRLAVQQTEALYNIVAAHPIFFKWSKDALAEVEGWKLRAINNYLFMVLSSFVVSLLCLIIAAWNFAWFDHRVPNAYTLLYDDATLQKCGYGTD